MIEWDEIDTVFLDVDGALIDLNFEFFLWHELVPQRYAQKHDVSIKVAKNRLFEAHVAKGLDLYSLPYWSNFTGLDMKALHYEIKHLLKYRPGVQTFLKTMKSVSARVAITTNAHSQSFLFKDENLALSNRVDAWYSSEHIGAPKEDGDFWSRLAKIEPFDPTRTVLIDDTLEVLDCARDFGIAHLITTTQPNLAQPARTTLHYPAIDNYMDLFS